MALNAESLTADLIVTCLVMLMVFLLPWIDRKVCARLGLNLQGGVSSNPRAETLLRARQILLLALFGVYLLALAWLVFFSRSAGDDFKVHVALFKDLKQSIRIDFGFLGVLRAFVREGFQGAASQVHVVNAADIAQVCMNIMLFVPMGYLLPYLFAWFREGRAGVRVRTPLACFAISLLIENIQLVARRGFYDVDDLVSNTAGGAVGAFLYLSAAYIVTHPGWKTELKNYQRWQRHARTSALYPFARRIAMARASLTAANEESVWDFYIKKLGFRLKKQIVPLDSPETDMLLEIGRLQIEVHCLNCSCDIAPQTLTISARRLKPVIKRLEAAGIDPGPVGQDPYTGLRRIRFRGPDGVWITVIER